jgi:hypothetical protein
MAKLILNPGTTFAREISLRGGRLTLGRSPENDIQINDATISSHHCEMNVSDISVSIKDLGSTNGSFIDGKRIDRAVLQSGQSVRLGNVEAQFDLGTVNIAIPEQQVVEEQTSRLLADGIFSCLNHPDIPGTLQCSECGRIFCEACVRTLPRLTGGVLQFCPLCPNAQVHKIDMAPGGKGKESFMDWLQQTLRINPRKKKKK